MPNRGRGGVLAGVIPLERSENGAYTPFVVLDVFDIVNFEAYMHLENNRNVVIKAYSTICEHVFHNYL